MARKALVTFDFPSAPTVGGATTWYVTPTGTNASGTWGISVTGNAGTATTLQTARNINGTSFNGSANITVAEPTFSGQLSVYTQTDANTFTGGLTARYLTSGATNKPTGTDHALLTMAYDSAWAVQLAGDWRTNTWYSRTEQSGTWGSWVTMLSSANYNSFAPTLTGTGASGNWGINVTGSSASTTGNAGTATTLQTARTINGVSFNGSANITIPRISATDDRTLAPADGSASYVTSFFTSWGNNNTSPYADALLFRTYTDSSGGNDNLVTFRKDVLGMRIWQQTYGSATAFASFKDVAWTDGTNATGTWTVSTSGNAGTATTLQTARTLTIGSTGKTFDGSANVSWTLGEIGAQGALTLTTTGTSGVATLVGNTLNIPNYATGGTGTVTSVGLSMPAMFAVTNSPVTTSGTLTATLASQTANTVFVAPNGTAGAPTFRSLVEADIPTLSQAKITNLTTDLSAKAPLASPAFTGTPSLPTGTTGVTQAVDNNTTALATTAYVVGQGYAKLASPALTGTPTAPTATLGTNTTQIATTAFVQAEIVADAVLLTTNQTVAGNKTFSGTTALASTSTIGGAVIGYRDVPVTISNSAITFALADAGKAFGKDNATAYTYTIPANGTVAFPVGTVITVFNNNATSNITIAITTDTLRLAGTTTTGSRTVAPFALCTLFKVSSTVWMASGAGVT